ncbi:hypothetical protein F5Y12DRAFT_245116 [Xylaria sp. FL1777]|nr:hypothetical protein F5Y12DRAFT_245116 [Xylaria sp. FL1777]
MTKSTEPTGSATTQTKTSQKHCWECLRRRLVCDSVQPICNRCRTGGLVCPGYGEKQPLRWVKPGQVTACTRERAKARLSAGVKTGVSNNTGVDGDSTEANMADRASSTSQEDSNDGGLLRELDALYLLGARQLRNPDAIMRYDIACENFAGVRASYIYNCEIYERSSPLSLLLEESRFKLPLAQIAHHLPAPIQGLFILLALGHQIHRLPSDIEANVRVQVQSAVSFWTYQVVRTLNEDIAQEKKQASDETMTGVLMLMMAGQQLQPSSGWRYHYRGLMQMMRIRGGIEKVWHECPHMHNGILSMVIGEVFANTTSPSHDQVTELSHPRRLNFLLSAWGGHGDVLSVYVGSICPLSLFSNVIQINHLRGLATRGMSNSPSSSSSSSSSSCSSFSHSRPIYADAQVILEQILCFSPEIYASINGNTRTQSKWLLVGRIHQSAIALYCILSLQHVLLLPESETLSRAVRMHYDRLLLDLKEGYKYRNFKNCFFWPLVVSGMCAVRGTAFERAFIADTLRDSVPHMGCSMPILARKVLMEFWGSGTKGWDDCFNQPYVFLM